MGTDYHRIENGLYGHKTELKEALRDAEGLPKWLYPEAPTSTADDHLGKHTSRGDFIADVKDSPFFEAAFQVYTTPNLKRTLENGRTINPRPVPGRIRDRINEWLAGPGERYEKRLGRGRWRDGPRVVVRLGPRGGIDEVYLAMAYRD